MKEEKLLELAAYAEDYSNHPISLSIKKAYGKKIDNSRISNVQEIAGHGVQAVIDGTPGCTNQAKAFRDAIESFNEQNAVILGISRDSVASHEKFIAKHELPFILLSDHEEIVCHLYDVLKEKNMYGKKAIGIERSTFLIDEAGIITKIYRKVKVAGHIEAVLESCSL